MGVGFRAFPSMAIAALLLLAATAGGEDDGGAAGQSAPIDLEREARSVRFGLTESALVEAVRDAKTDTAARFLSERLLLANDIESYRGHVRGRAAYLELVRAMHQRRRVNRLLAECGTEAAAAKFAAKSDELTSHIAEVTGVLLKKRDP